MAKETKGASAISLNVNGMHCNSCKILIEDALSEIGATNIKVEVDEKKQMGKVSCDYTDKGKVIEAIKREGYTVKA